MQKTMTKPATKTNAQTQPDTRDQALGSRAKAQQILWVIQSYRWALQSQAQLRLGLKPRQASACRSRSEQMGAPGRAAALDAPIGYSIIHNAPGTGGTNHRPLLPEGNLKQGRLGEAEISEEEGLHPTWPGDGGFLIGLLQSQSL